MREGFSVWWDQTLNPGEAYDRGNGEGAGGGQGSGRALVEEVGGVALGPRRGDAGRAARTLVPVMIEPCKRPIMFELTHTADLSHWKGDPDDPGMAGVLSGRAPVCAQGRDNVAHSPVLQSRHSATIAALLASRLRCWRLAGCRRRLLVLWTNSPSDAGPGCGGSRPARRRCHLAVLPFADMSPAKDQEYFSDGLTEEILNELAQIKDLLVTGAHLEFFVQGQERGHPGHRRRSWASPTSLKAACARMATSCASPRS